MISIPVALNMSLAISFLGRDAVNTRKNLQGVWVMHVFDIFG